MANAIHAVVPRAGASAGGAASAGAAGVFALAVACVVFVSAVVLTDAVAGCRVALVPGHQNVQEVQHDEDDENGNEDDARD